MLGAFLSKRTVKQQPQRGFFMYWLVMIFTFLLLFDQIRISLLTQSVFMPGAGLDAIGIAIAILGLIIAVWARVMLSNNWSGAVVLKENHTLITTGPYRYVRHPIYTGLLVMMLGTVFISAALMQSARFLFSLQRTSEKCVRKKCLCKIIFRAMPIIKNIRKHYSL